MEQQQRQSAETGLQPRQQPSVAADKWDFHGSWRLPETLLPLPAGDRSIIGGANVVNLHGKPLAELAAIAARHNAAVNVAEDPFEVVLRGIPERAALRPDSRPAMTFTLGHAPPGSGYAKAWRSLRRRPSGRSSSSGGANRIDAAVAQKRPEAAAAAAIITKLQARAAGGPAPPPRPASAALPPQQAHWRAKLAEYLGRPVDFAPLSPEAPQLDLMRLFQEVASASRIGTADEQQRWPELAAALQGSAALAEPLSRVYHAYLAPLQRGLQQAGLAPDRALEHCTAVVAERTALGARCGSYGACFAAASYAAAALRAAAGNAAQSAAEATEQQQPLWTQQPQEPPPQPQPQRGPPLQPKQGKPPPTSKRTPAATAVQDDPPARRVDERDPPAPAPVPPTALQLLRWAASNPGAAAGTVLGAGMRPALHAPDRAVCATALRRAAAEARPRGLSEEDASRLAAAAEKELVVELSSAGVDAPPGQARRPPRSERDRDDVAALEAARALLLARRARLAGPPGAGAPPLRAPPPGAGLAAMPGKPAGTGKRTSVGFITPRCGVCHTCRRPNLKKACMTNRARLARGLPPITSAGGVLVGAEESVRSESGHGETDMSEANEEGEESASPSS